MSSPKAADTLNDCGFIEGTTSRAPIDPARLQGMGTALCVVAFASVAWVMKTFRCTEAEARQFKVNAQYDFENALEAVRRAKGQRH